MQCTRKREETVSVLKHIGKLTNKALRDIELIADLIFPRNRRPADRRTCERQDPIQTRVLHRRTLPLIDASPLSGLIVTAAARQLPEL
jgi:hypothetical protein